MRQIKIKPLSTLALIGLGSIVWQSRLARADLTDTLDQPPAAQEERPSPAPPSQEPPARPERKEGPPERSPAPLKETKAARAKEESPKRGRARKEPGAKTAGPRHLPVHFQGDGFSGERQGGVLEFHSNVKVEQGDFSIFADKARVYLDPNTDEVESVIATGNVRISKIDPKTGQLVKARSQSAEFENSTQRLLLKGEAELERGKDLIKGNFISYDMKTGWMHAGKVKGVVQPGEGR